MLYQLYELQRAALAPVQVWAEATRTAFSHPWMPGGGTAFGRAAAASAEMVARVTGRYDKPAFGLTETTVRGRPVAVSEEVVARWPFCELRRFRREATGANLRDPRILIVAPMSGHHATLLRDTVAALLPAHDVLITDWVDARRVPIANGPFGLDDYIAYLVEMLRTLGPGTSVLAVCQPSVPALAATALLAADDDPCQPASLILMGGPIDARVNPTGPNLLAAAQSRAWFEQVAITQVPFYYPGAFRRVFPGFLQLSGFMSMNLDRHIGAHIGFFKHLIEGDGDSAEAHRRFYDEYLSVMDLPAEFYLDTVERVFQRFELAGGTFDWRGRRVDPAAIRQTALLTIEGERDDISAPGQTRAAHDLCVNIPPHRRLHHVQPDVGHFGIFNGRRWREQVMPLVRGFIRSRGGRRLWSRLG